MDRVPILGLPNLAANGSEATATEREVKGRPNHGQKGNQKDITQTDQEIEGSSGLRRDRELREFEMG